MHMEVQMAHFQLPITKLYREPTVYHPSIHKHLCTLVLTVYAIGSVVDHVYANIDPTINKQPYTDLERVRPTGLK